MPLFTRAHTTDSKRLYDGDIINLRVDSLKVESGHETTREVIEHNGGVVIACQHEPGEVVLIRQYRYTVDQELIELPAGRIELGEDPLAAARRELTEETGYLANDWQELARMYSAPGFCTELLYLYLATNVSIVGKNLDEDEETEVLLMPVKKAWQLVLDGKVTDAKTIAGLGMLMAR